MTNMENFYYDFTAIDPNKDISNTRQVHVVGKINGDKYI
jgi:hypothetical protein